MNWISIIVSGISIVIAIYAAVSSRKTSNKANLISMGTLENSLRDLISQSRRNMEDKGLFISTLKVKKTEDFDKEERKQFEIIRKAYSSAVEDWLNAYEEACAKYLDGKVDKERFRKTYKQEITNIVKVNKDNLEIHDLIHPESTSRYRSIWKVYREWEYEE